MTSMTRASPGTRYTPGLSTAPAACTTMPEGSGSTELGALPDDTATCGISDSDDGGVRSTHTATSAAPASSAAPTPTSKTRCEARNGRRPSSDSTRARQPSGGGTGRRSDIEVPQKQPSARGSSAGRYLQLPGHPFGFDFEGDAAIRGLVRIPAETAAEVRPEVPAEEADVAEVIPLHDVDDLVADEPRVVCRPRPHTDRRADRDALRAAWHGSSDPEAVTGAPHDRHRRVSRPRGQ